jgi:hypothetical protein
MSNIDDAATTDKNLLTGRKFIRDKSWVLFEKFKK